MNNLEIWESVEKTDLGFVKTVNQRGGFTSIDAMYQAKMATEKFGPYGHGWGLAESDFDMRLYESTKMVIHKAVFFYLLDGAVIAFPIHNAIKPSPVSNGQEKDDEEWCKKVETNTISKALSRLGFNADVFLGKFDDAEYKEQLATEQYIEKADDKDKAVTEKRGELRDYITKQLDAIKELGPSNATTGVANVAVRHLERQRLIPSLTGLADKGIKAINDAKSATENKPA